MKKRIVCSVVTFVLCLCICALLAWLAGFNFDHRSADVAFAAAFGLLMSLGTAGMVAVHPGWGK